MTALEDRVRVGVDIGGTFTDIVVFRPDGRIHTKKVLSTTGDYSRAIADGLSDVFAETDVAAGSIGEVLHGTTVATNAILERRGALTGLLTTRGFRDVLELGRMRRPVLYDLFWEKPVPLVQRGLRLEVEERLDAEGTEVVPVRHDDVRAAVQRFAAEGIQSIAVCFLHAYQNPAHEQQVAAMLAQAFPHVPISISSDVLPEIKEYERTSTTVINAYIRPTVESYLDQLLGRLRAIGVTAPVLVMRSSGGVMPAREAAQHPIHIVESGPAAGVIGSAQFAREMGLGDVIAFDMGGTTAKTSIIENGQPSLAHEYQVGAGISIGARLQSGGGYLLRVPAIDLAEVGAGGGSIVSIDKGGALQVGPESAGAVPGPVCYQRGGTAPTITDANVTLGYINPTGVAGGTVPLDAAAAARVLEAEVAAPLGMSLLEACYGVHTVANVRMIRAIKAVSTERGRDPRQFTLVAFGGSGPVHAAEMARSLEIPRVVVPPAPGLFSAFGLLMTNVESHTTRTHRTLLEASALADMEQVYRELEEQAAATLERDGYAVSTLTRFADLRYVKQSYELLTAVPARLDLDSVRVIAAAFETEHERTYSYKDERGQIEVVNLRVLAKAVPPRLAVGATGRSDGHVEHPAGTLHTRMAFFGPAGLHETPITDRVGVGSVWRAGPLIVEEYDSTIVIPPGCAAHLDNMGNIVISTKGGGSGIDS